MKKIILVTVLFTALFLSGCEQMEPPSSPPPFKSNDVVKIKDVDNSEIRITRVYPCDGSPGYWVVFGLNREGKEVGISHEDFSHYEIVKAATN